jgi:hypothetical protein
MLASNTFFVVAMQSCVMFVVNLNFGTRFGNSEKFEVRARRMNTYKYVGRFLCLDYSCYQHCMKFAKISKMAANFPKRFVLLTLNTCIE